MLIFGRKKKGGEGMGRKGSKTHSGMRLPWRMVEGILPFRFFFVPLCDVLHSGVCGNTDSIFAQQGDTSMDNAQTYRRIGKRLLQWCIAAVAYAYLFYTLFTFAHYDELAHAFAEATVGQYIAFVACLLLMPLNLLLEAWKWRSLLHTIEPISLQESYRQVCYGMAGAFVTPYRVGDYPSRILLLKDRTHYVPAMARAVLGSIMLTVVILVAGMVAFGIGWADTGMVKANGITHYIGLILLLIAGLSVVIIVVPRVSRKYKITHSDCNLFLLQSLCRYLCFSLQLWLMLYFCGVGLSAAQAVVWIPIYYLLVTVTPNMPIADIGIRGSLAVVVFGYAIPSVEANIVLATTGLWFINTLLPVLFGGLCVKRTSFVRYSKSG